MLTATISAILAAACVALAFYAYSLRQRNENQRFMPENPTTAAAIEDGDVAPSGDVENRHSHLRWVTCYCGEDTPLELIKPLNFFGYRATPLAPQPEQAVNALGGGIVHCLACDEVFAFGPKGKFWRKRRPQQPAEGLAPNANVVPRPPADRGGLPRVPREAPTV